MKGLGNSSFQNKELTKSTMNSFYFDDPKESIEREFKNVRLKYFYFDSELKLKTKNKEVLNGSLLEGNAILTYNNAKFDLNQFDIFFIPPEKEFRIKPKNKNKNKICLVFSLSVKDVDAKFEIQRFNLEKFIPRGELGSEHKMATYRTVWTAIKNDFFMSGFTNIPNESLKQGVVTSVNLEEN